MSPPPQLDSPHYSVLNFQILGKQKGVNTRSDSGWDLIPGQYGHVCGSRVNQWTSSGQREDQQDYADGACEGQTFRLQTYLFVTNAPCKSLAKKVVYFCDPEIFCHLKRDRIIIKVAFLCSFGDLKYDKLGADIKLHAVSIIVIMSQRYCLLFQFILW